MEEDRRISPYHPLLSLAWGGHVNIQLVGDNDLVMYLCKYHAKASPAKYIKLTDDVLVDLGMGLGNELQRMICEHFLSIVISVPEAVMVLLGLNFVHFYSTTHSDPLRLPVILPHQQGQIFVRGQATDDLITVYGCRPVGPEFDNPTFVEYHTQYARSRQAKVREEEEEGRGEGEEEGDDGGAGGQATDSHGYVVRRRRKPSVPVMDWLTPTDGERFYFGILLRRQPFRQLQELKSEVRLDFDHAYREQCHRKGYVGSDEEAVEMALDEGARRGFTTTSLQSHRQRLEQYLESLQYDAGREEEEDGEEDGEEEDGRGERGDAFRMLSSILRSNQDDTGFTDVVED
jgi:hypothetical protein